MSLSPERGPSRKRFRGKKQQPALTGSLGDNPDVRGRSDFWAEPIERGHRVAHVKSGAYDFCLGLKTLTMLIQEVGRFSDNHEAFQAT